MKVPLNSQYCYAQRTNLFLDECKLHNVELYKKEGLKERVNQLHPALNKPWKSTNLNKLDPLKIKKLHIDSSKPSTPASSDLDEPAFNKALSYSDDECELFKFDDDPELVKKSKTPTNTEPNSKVERKTHQK